MGETNQQTTSTAEFERTKFARELLSKEIQYRRDRQSQIFSWTNGILVGIIGGVIALTGTNKGFVINNFQKAFLAIAVAGFHYRTLFPTSKLKYRKPQES